jgi:hypothetical protein
VEAAHSLPGPHLGATRSTEPILPPSQPRPAPQFERRALEVQLAPRPTVRRTPMRAYLGVAFALAAVSVGGWFALGEYIYG